MSLSDYFIAITLRSTESICSDLLVSAIWRALSRKRKFDPYLLDNSEMVQGQESQLLAVGGLREIVCAGTLYRSQLALLERVCLSKPQLPALEHSRIQLNPTRQD